MTFMHHDLTNFCVSHYAEHQMIDSSTRPHTVTGWPKKTGTLCFIRLNLVKYRLMFKFISLSESGVHL